MASLTPGGLCNLMFPDTFVKTLNVTMTYERKSKTTDGMGGFTESWTSMGSFNARISSIKASEGLREAMHGEKKWADVTHKVFCEPFDLRETDRLVYGTTWTFEIIAITKPSEISHHLEVMCRELT